MMKTLTLATVLPLVLCWQASALQPEDDAVFIRVIDVGPGLCCVVKMPGKRYMIYDAGNHEDMGHSAFKGIMELIPMGTPLHPEAIDLMILSHTDSDHLASVPLICAGYRVKTVFRSGWTKPPKTWRRANLAIEREVADDDTEDYNLALYEFPTGEKYKYGGVTITMVFGRHKADPAWGTMSRSERRNAGSIVVRLEYKGKSVLICGDSVGRHTGSANDFSFAAEAAMTSNASNVPIKSDVIIAPHHGADNGSSLPFITEVSPKYVIFSAGSKYEHPRKAVAQRYLSLPTVTPSTIFRTDFGDDEGGKEWALGRVAGHKDPAGDDDVDILIKADGTLEVAYRNPAQHPPP